MKILIRGCTENKCQWNELDPQGMLVCCMPTCGINSLGTFEATMEFDYNKEEGTLHCVNFEEG
jgi:hypothetical protein